MFLWRREPEKVDMRKERAAIRIQMAYRRRLALRMVCDAYHNQHRKLYDGGAKKNVYQNKRTLDVALRLPKFLPKSSVLPSPRDFEAPLEYDPGSENTALGHILLVVNNQFPLGKWPPAASELVDDFDGIKLFLEHEFIGRIRPENILALKNPTTNEMADAFKDLRRKVRTDGFLVVYIATHVVTINKGNKELPEENAYFAFRNSIWSPKKNIETIDTSISLTQLSVWMNSIACREKSIFVNFAHAPAPRKTLFPSSKYVYPPSDFVFRLSNMCHCPVVASCSNGFLAHEYARVHPPCLYDKDFVHRRLFRSSWQGKHGSSTFEQEKKENVLNLTAREILELMQDRHDQQLRDQEPKKQQRNVRIAPMEEETKEESPNSRHNPVALDHGHLPHDGSSNDQATEPLPLSLSSLFTSYHWQRLMTLWEVPPNKPIRITPKPAPPVAQWESQGVGSESTISVTVPTDQELGQYSRRVLFWRVRRGLAKPVNFVRQVRRYRRSAQLCSPRETSLVHNGHTLFAAAFLETLRLGTACLTSEDAVRLDTFYYHLQLSMARMIQGLRLQRKRDLEAEEAAEKQQLADAEAENGSASANADGNDDDLSDTLQRKRKKAAGATKPDKKKKKKKAKKKGKKKGETAAEELIAQTPVLALPRSPVPWRSSSSAGSVTKASSSSSAAYQMTSTEAEMRGLTHRLFYKCGPPPAPERPYVTFVTKHSVALTWYNPIFAGIAPMWYRLRMQNVSRSFRDWSLVPLPGGPSSAQAPENASLSRHIAHYEELEEDRRAAMRQGYDYYCIHDTKYTVSDLPMGVACRFSVQAFNAGGWSQWSEPTDYVTPGEEDLPIPAHLTWKRLGQAGVLGILDHMVSLKQHRDAQLRGFQRLLAFGTCHHGFKDTSMALQVAQHCIWMLRNYSDDPDLLRYVLSTMIWTLVGGKYTRKVRTFYLQVPLPVTVAEVQAQQQQRRKRSSIAAQSDTAKEAASTLRLAASSAVANINNAATIAAGASEDTSEADAQQREYLLQQSLGGLLERIFVQWRHHAGVVNALQGLRGAANLARYLPPGAGLVPVETSDSQNRYAGMPLLFPPPPKEDDEDAEDDEEVEGDKDEK